MAGTALGATKAAAKRLGISVEEYETNLATGLKWCGDCRCWIARKYFNKDRHRGDGLKATCALHDRTEIRKKRIIGSPSRAIHGAAVNAVRTAIRRGQLSKPTKHSCVDCQGQAEQYHHQAGYDPEHWLNVVALCRSCHSRRHWGSRE